MIWLPLLHNSPCWVPKRFFLKVNSIFRSFTWRGTTPRVKFEILQYPADSGGLAVPNVWVYFLAAQLQHLAGWESVGEQQRVYKIIDSPLSVFSPITASETTQHSDAPRSKPTSKLIRNYGRLSRGFWLLQTLLDEPFVG